MPHLPGAVKSEGPTALMMLPTLQKYIFKEMGKTFALAALGLTLVLTTCGGAVSIIPLQNLSARHTLMLLGLVVPISAAFTLPIAALFSATMTYGRLAADNEFTAIRSSGINTYVLFAPCLLLSLFSAVATFALFNFLIPGLMSQVRVLSRESVMDIMASALSSGEGISSFGNYRIRAESVERIKPGAAGTEHSSGLLLKGVVFIEFDPGQADEDEPLLPGGNQIVRVGSSEYAILKFDYQGDSTQIEASLYNNTVYLPEASIHPRSEFIRIGPVKPPSGLSSKPRPKHLSLPGLLASRKHPEQAFTKVADELQKTQRMILAKLLIDDLEACLQSWPTGCSLRSATQTVQISARQTHIISPRRWQSAGLGVSDVVVVEESTAGRREYRAEAGIITLQYSDGDEATVIVTLSDEVTVKDLNEDNQPVKVRDAQLGPFALPRAVTERLASSEFETAQLWNPKAKFGLGPEVERQCKKLRKRRSKYLHQVFAEIHVRTVYSISVLVLAVLGAALGIIYRGGQLLVAFGISFVPTLFVILMTILGKTIAKGESTLLLGLAIMWLGLVVVAALDYVVFRKYLPR